ncbi:MAG: hypothetical protein JXL67_13210 [Calditrichaeota bacterium]|nr:hypothetical protein [Calditrichota bacterium]
MLRSLFNRIRRKIGLSYRKDNRGRRLVAVIECIINQNARDAGAATFPAMDWDVVRLCNQYHVGILQLPCPEIHFLGFDRNRKPGESIRNALDTEAGRESCRKISMEIADRFQTYINQGYQILAILGGNPESPGCAVHIKEGALLANSGVFMKELQDELHKRSIDIPFQGIRDSDPDMLAEDIEWFRKILSQNNKK